MPQYVKDYVDQFSQREGCDIVQEEFETVTDSALDNANVLCVTRVQKERFDTVEEYNKVKGVYVVDEDFMRKAPSKMIVMHPLPRVDEISTMLEWLFWI